MKKAIIILLTVLYMISSVSLAEDFTSLPDAELLSMYRQISAELESRGIDPERDDLWEKDPEDRPENPSLSASFNDAVEAADRFAFVGGDIDYLAAVAEQEGKYIRMVTLLDDHAKELYMAAMGAEDSGEAYEAFQSYAWSLPVTYTEALTVKPKEQAELDEQAGRMVGELLAEGYSFYGIGGGEYLPTIVDLSYGMFNYEFEVDASFEQYRENEGWDELEEMKVKSGKLSGFSGIAINLDYLADGTYEPQFVPHITAEEQEARNQVPPAEEYTAKAWPLSDEGYADLLNNKEARYGQVYMVKGVVHQILSRTPATVIVNTSADGKSQPVMIEFPEQLSFSAEVGSDCRIYADVTSSCYILPVLTARYAFSGLTADPADEPVPADDEDTFTVPNIIAAKGAEDFIGEWHYFRIVNEDGTEMNRAEMLAEGLVDDHAEIVITKDEIKLYSASAGDVGSVKYEFVPDNGSLRILNEGDELPVLRPADNGMLVLFMPAYGMSSGSTTAYLIRGETYVRNTIEGNIKTYYEMTDGTWMCDGRSYKYRLEIKGRMPNAAADSSFVYLSNIEEITFDQAYKAAGISSNSEDYFPPEKAVLAEMN